MQGLFLNFLEPTENNLGGREDQAGKTEQTESGQILLTPSQRLPFDLNAGALHPFPNHRLLRQVTALSFHPQLLHAPDHSPAVTSLPMQLPMNLPEPP